MAGSAMPPRTSTFTPRSSASGTGVAMYSTRSTVSTARTTPRPTQGSGGMPGSTRGAGGGTPCPAAAAHGSCRPRATTRPTTAPLRESSTSWGGSWGRGGGRRWGSGHGGSQAQVTCGGSRALSRSSGAGTRRPQGATAAGVPPRAAGLRAANHRSTGCGWCGAGAPSGGHSRGQVGRGRGEATHLATHHVHRHRLPRHPVRHQGRKRVRHRQGSLHGGPDLGHVQPPPQLRQEVANQPQATQVCR
jgi:hypothetical protein